MLCKNNVAQRIRRYLRQNSFKLFFIKRKVAAYFFLEMILKNNRYNLQARPRR